MDFYRHTAAIVYVVYMQTGVPASEWRMTMTANQVKKQYVLYSKTLKKFVTEYPADGNVQWSDELDSAERRDLGNARAALYLMCNKTVVVLKVA